MKHGVDGQGQGELRDRVARVPEGPQPIPTEKELVSGKPAHQLPPSTPHPAHPSRGQGSSSPRLPSSPAPGHHELVAAVSIPCDRVLLCPSAQVETPFYQEWWFLLVMALSSLIVILLLVFALVLHGQNRRYRSCSTGGASALSPTPAPPPTPPLEGPMHSGAKMATSSLLQSGIHGAGFAFCLPVGDQGQASDFLWEAALGSRQAPSTLEAQVRILSPPHKEPCVLDPLHLVGGWDSLSLFPHPHRCPNATGFLNRTHRASNR